MHGRMMLAEETSCIGHRFWCSPPQHIGRHVEGEGLLQRDVENDHLAEDAFEADALTALRLKSTAVDGRSDPFAEPWEAQSKRRLWSRNVSRRKHGDSARGRDWHRTTLCSRLGPRTRNSFSPGE